MLLRFAALLLALSLSACEAAPTQIPNAPHIEGLTINLGDSLERVREVTRNTNERKFDGTYWYLEPFGDGTYVYFDAADRVVMIRLLSGAEVTIGGLRPRGYFDIFLERLGPPDTESWLQGNKVHVVTYYLDLATSVSFYLSESPLKTTGTIVDTRIVKNDAHPLRKTWPDPALNMQPSQQIAAANVSSAQTDKSVRQESSEPRATQRPGPMAVLNALVDRIYVIGETTGKASDMVAAEAKAADQIRQYVADGLTAGLIEIDKGKQSPLAAAAYMGYPNVVSALLTSRLVREHINDSDEIGMTPWIAASFAMKQSLWTCNPAVFENPDRFIPMFVTQPYYASNPEPPYKKTREVLEVAGASADSTKAKEIWLSLCKNSSATASAKVKASKDLQSSLQELGATDIVNQLLKLQRRAAETQVKP